VQLIFFFYAWFPAKVNHFTWNHLLKFLLYLDILTPCKKLKSEKSCSVEPLHCYSTPLNVLEWELFNSPCWHGKHILYSALSDRWGVSSGDQGSLSPCKHILSQLSQEEHFKTRHAMTTNQPPPDLENLSGQQTQATECIQNLLRGTLSCNRFDHEKTLKISIKGYKMH